MLPKRSISHALFAAILAIAAFAPAAKAGTYTVPFCDRSASGQASTWTHANTLGATPYFYVDKACPTRIYRRFDGYLVPAGASDDWTFDAPAGTYVSQVDIDQFAAPRSAGAMIALYSWQQDGSRTLVSAVRQGEELGNVSYSFPLSGSKVVKLRDSLLCQEGADCAGNWNNMYGNEHYFNGALVWLVDPSLPVFSSVTGDGWIAEPADGQRSIAYAVSDSGAGVKEARLYVDGALASTKTWACAAEALVPCPLATQGTFTFSTTKLAEGQHDLELRLVDGSLNEEKKQLSITVRRAPAAHGSSTGGVPVSVTDTTASTGAPAVGDRLHGSNGTWIGSGLTFTYQWMRCAADSSACLPIPGATTADYTPTSADVGHALQFCVTATNSGGSTTSCSVPTAAVIASRAGTPTNTADPVERPGTPVPKPSTPLATPPTAGVADRGTPNGSPAADRVVLTALANNRSSTMKVKFGKRVPISGRLVGAGGVPIADAVLEVQTRTAMPGAAVATAGKVVTRADGRFTYNAPAGPSRVVRIAYRSHSADSSFADTTDVTLLVVAGVTMKATPRVVRNRHATFFTGRLLGKPIAKRGVVIDLQVFFRNKWRTFGAPRTTSAGKYKFKYRFMAGAATWKFRARVRRESSYPYIEGYSRKAVKVKVTN